MTVGFFVTLIVALLAGLGVGSAGLFMTWLTLIEKVPQLTAQGINLIFFIFSSGAALAIHVFRTPLLWQSLIPLIVSGAGGSFLGASLATILPQEVLQRLFGCVLIFLGIFELFLRGRFKKKS